MPLYLHISRFVFLVTYSYEQSSFSDPFWEAVIAAWTKWKVATGRSVLTPIDILLDNFVCTFKKFATFMLFVTCHKGFRIPEASRTILFRIDFGCRVM